MMNIIRADFYRLLRGKVIYALFGILAVASAVLMIVHGMGGSNEYYEVSTRMSNFEMLSFMTVFVIICTLPIFTSVAGPIFMDGTAKNEVSWGVSRAKLYLARVVVCAVLCVLLLATFYGVGIATTIPFCGFGDGTASFWINFLLTFVSQSFMMTAACMLGIFLVFSMKNVVAVVEVFMFIFFLPTLIYQFLPMIADIDMGGLMRILYFDLTTNMARMGDIGGIETRSLLIIIAVSVAWFVIPTIIGIMKFQRKEVK